MAHDGTKDPNYIWRAQIPGITILNMENGTIRQSLPLLNGLDSDIAKIPNSSKRMLGSDAFEMLMSTRQKASTRWYSWMFPQNMVLIIAHNLPPNHPCSFGCSVAPVLGCLHQAHGLLEIFALHSMGEASAGMCLDQRWSECWCPQQQMRIWYDMIW